MVPGGRFAGRWWGRWWGRGGGVAGRAASCRVLPVVSVRCRHDGRGGFLTGLADRSEAVRRRRSVVFVDTCLLSACERFFRTVTAACSRHAPVRCRYQTQWRGRACTGHYKANCFLAGNYLLPMVVQSRARLIFRTVLKLMEVLGRWGLSSCSPVSCPILTACGQPEDGLPGDQAVRVGQLVPEGRLTGCRQNGLQDGRARATATTGMWALPYC